MKNFLEWMVSEAIANIVFTSWMKDGTITVVAGGTKYKFITDAVHHLRWKREARFNPAKVLSEIAQQVRTGRAQQLEPTPINKQQKCATCGPEEICPICSTPYPNYQSGVECPSCGYIER